MKKIDIVIPCYNEQSNIGVIADKIRNFFDSKFQGVYDFSVIFVNDGSTDQSIETLKREKEKDNRIKYLNFSRNFGHQIAVKAGCDYSCADAVISMDADLQHPVETIEQMLEKWEEGYQVVGTIRQYADGAAGVVKRNSKYFYKILNLISEEEIRDGAADFRLLDKKVVDVLRKINEKEPFLRGIVPWMGFKQIYIPYVAQKRFSGQSKYTFKKMAKLAISGITSFSVKPLYFAVYLGFLFSFLSVLYVPYVILAFIRGTEISGWASLIMTIVFFGGLNLIILGIIGIYIGKIFKQTKNRPDYIVSEFSN